jgi:membrane protein implicated in regulation of membrane protease activity
MSDANLWWLCAGAAVIVELMTGSFYLLMVGLGLAAGAAAAHAGLGSAAQVAVAALLGSGAVASLTYVRRRRAGDPSARADRSVNLDVGEILQIDAWQADATAQVRYRGASWTAMARAGVTPQPGSHRVAELVGNRLLVDKV